MSLREGAVGALWPYCGGSAEDALGALCDYLTEHVDEWWQQAWGHSTSAPIPDSIVALMRVHLKVLRESSELVERRKDRDV